MTGSAVPASAAPPEPPVWEGRFDLVSLVRQLGGVAERRATFREVRRIAALDQPLESTGTLLWRRPDLIEKITEWPIRERVTVRGDRFELASPGRPVQVLDLGMQPELRTLLAALRAPLAGDAAALERDFEVGLAGAPAAWTLRLVPRDRQARRFVTVIEVAGSLAEPSAILVREAQGDEQSLRLEPLP